jgi:hypothetical protein
MVVVVAAVFLILFILVIVGVPRRHRRADEAQPREDTFRRALGHGGLPLDGQDVRRQSLIRCRPDSGAVATWLGALGRVAQGALALTEPSGAASMRRASGTGHRF